MREPQDFKRPKAKYAKENREIGQRLRSARERAGYTQGQAAAALGEAQSYVSKIEKAERRADLAEGRALIVLYNVDANEILFPERVAEPPAPASAAGLAAEKPQPRKRGAGGRKGRLKFRAPAARKKQPPRSRPAATPARKRAARRKR